MKVLAGVAFIGAVAGFSACQADSSLPTSCRPKFIMTDNDIYGAQ